MRIAYFSDNFYPELSGITDTILITGKQLQSRGHEICYVAPRYVLADYAKAKRQMLASDAEDIVDGMRAFRLPSVRLPYSPTGQSRFALPFGGSFKFLKTFKPDLIHSQSPYSVGWEAIRAAKHFNIPLLGTNHTAIEDFISPGFVMRTFDAWYYNHCSFISTPYQGLIDRMREVGFKREAKVVRNPAELSLFTPPTPEEKASDKKALGIEGPMMLYCGRVAVEKRIDVIINAMPTLLQKFPTLTLVIPGNGADEGRLKALAQTLGVAKHVRFTGFLSREALAHLYKAAEVFTFMSTSDSQSLALMQGYASGLPAVCARARGLPDYTPEDCGYLVEPGNSNEMAEKVELLLTNNELREKMGQAAVNYAKKFAPNLIADEWEAIYTKYATPRV